MITIIQVQILFLFLLISAIFVLISNTSENSYEFFSNKAIITYTILLIILMFDCIIIISDNYAYIYKLTIFKNFFLLTFSMFYMLAFLELNSKKTVNINIVSIVAIIPFLAFFIATVPSLNVFYANYTQYIVSRQKYIVDGQIFFIMSHIYLSFCFVTSFLIYIQIIRKSYINLKKIIFVTLAIIIFGYAGYLYRDYLNYNHAIIFTNLIFCFCVYILYTISTLYLYIKPKKLAVESIVNEQKNLIIGIDINGFVMFINNAFLNKFTINRYDILGESIYNNKNIEKIFSKEIYNNLVNEKSGDMITINDKVYKKNIIKIVKKNKTVGDLISYFDYTDEYNYSETLKKIIITDDLTGFGNRYSFELESLSIDKEDYDLLSVVLIDLDNLKITNDVFGSEKGDEILLTLSFLIKETFQKGNFVGYRLGGDEFCIIIHSEPEEYVADKITELYLKTSEYNNNNQRQILFSVGCASKSEKGKTISELYKFADISLYKSKKDGKNRTTFFSDEIYNDFILKNKINDDYEDAIKNGDFIPYLKPKFDLKSQTYDGCEIIICWNHKELGLLYQDKFFSKNNEIMVDTPLEFIMLEKVLQSVDNWNKKYKNVPIEIFLKVSLKNIINMETATFIESTCKKYNIAPSSIVFQISDENSIITSDLIKESVVNLKKLGVKFLIDEFGKGSANFHTIELFEADYVKIDKYSVESCDLNKKNKDNLELICRLLKSYNCKIIADGVSNQSHLNMLKSFSVDSVQGRLFKNYLCIKGFEKIYYEKS